MDILLVVDIQNDLLPGGPLGVPDGHAVIEPTNRLLAQFGESVATQVWHPPDHISFAANHPGTAHFERIEQDGIARTLWPTHCVAGTLGAEFAKELDADRFSHVTRKGTEPHADCLGGFEDDRGNPTDLDGALRARGATRLFVCGLALDVAVWATVGEALKRKYRVVLVEDACRGIDPINTARATQDMKIQGVTLATSNKLPLT